MGAVGVEEQQVAAKGTPQKPHGCNLTSVTLFIVDFLSCRPLGAFMTFSTPFPSLQLHQETRVGPLTLSLGPGRVAKWVGLGAGAGP